MVGEEILDIKDEQQMQGTMPGSPGACSPVRFLKKWCYKYLVHSRAPFSNYNFDISRGKFLKIMSML